MDPQTKKFPNFLINPMMFPCVHHIKLELNLDG
jgi:hypothetical protein